MSRLNAELWRRPAEPKAASYELVETAPVVEKRNEERGTVALEAVVRLGIIDTRAYRWLWVVRRADGSVLERRANQSFRLVPDPEHRRASDKAKDWPCAARYYLHLRISEAERYLTESSCCRDPVTLNFRRADPN